MCVQTAVEKPVIYILARCAPTDGQIKYTQTRVGDLKEFQHKLQTKKGDVTDVMRFFHGDSPACSFEIGHQKGGNYFCWDCGIFAKKSDDMHIIPISNLSNPGLIKLKKPQQAKKKSL